MIMKIKWLLLVLLFAAGCFGAELRTWEVGGVMREALVYLPENMENHPLVFVFHGHGGNVQRISRMFRIHELWPEAAVVYMQGLPTPGKRTDPEGKRSGWNSNPNDSANRDLNFFDAVVESLAGSFDTRRVFSMGHSNGGGFTYCLWAARPELLAAFAPSSTVARNFTDQLVPKPAMHIAGKTDPIVKYAWQEPMMNFIKTLNGCGEGEPWHSANDLAGTFYPAPNPFVTLIHPGGHTFPSEAPELIVRFFKQHSQQE